MYGSPVTVANRMKSDYGTDMYTIGIGVEVDEEILQKMASPGQYVRLKHTSDLKDITEFLLNGKIGKKKEKNEQDLVKFSSARAILPALH